MSADIMPDPSSSTSTRLKAASSKASKTSQQRLASFPQDDPALIIGLALAFARQGQGDTRAIPSVVFDLLSDLASSGEPTCRLVLDCLDRRACANHRTDAGQGRPTEIVSVHPALEDR